jgi:hypothetical protein
MKGQTQSFSATVQGTNSPAQTVTWSVEGGVTGTSITGGGVLTVAANESAASLTVRATSAFDTSKSGTAAVTVTTGGGSVVMVYPADGASGALVNTDITLSRTGTDEYTLIVSGTFDSYRWWVDGLSKEITNTIVLNAADYRMGVHQITVEVTLGGIVYSKTGSFRIQD